MSLTISNLNATPLSRGNVIRLSWTNPTGITFREVRVHRRTDEFSRNFTRTGSQEIYRGTANTIFDFRANGLAVTSERNIPEFPSNSPAEQLTWIQGERFYYYTVFVEDTAGLVHFFPNATVCGVATKKYNLGEYLYNELPAVYRNMDKTRAELRKLCSIVGEQLDHLYSLFNIGRRLNSPFSVHPDFLPVLAKSIGWELNQELTVPEQRRIVRRMGSVYRSAGTLAGLDALVKFYSGFPATSSVVEGFSRIKRSVLFPVFATTPENLAHRTPNFATGGTNFSLVGTANDPLFYTWDFRANALTGIDTFTAIIQRTHALSAAEEQAMIRRVETVLNEFIPIGAKFQIRVL